MAIEKAQPKEIANVDRRDYKPIAISNAMRPIALALIARGGIPYEEMSDIMHKTYKVTIEPEELQRMAKTNITAISELRKDIKKAAVAEASKMLKKVDKILDRNLDRTLADMEKQETLDALVNNGLMEEEEYNQATRKMRIMPLAEVLKIAEHLTPKPVAPTGAHSPGTNPPIAAAPIEMTQLSKELAEALHAGNTVRIQELMYTPAAEAQP